MDCAYLFPFGVTIDASHVTAAKPVTLDTPYDELIQGSHHRRLRCSYIACLEQVKPVRRDADDDTDLRCFSHVEPASPARFCPYRTESSDYYDPVTKRRYPREHNPRKVVENDLRFELERKLTARGLKVVIRASPYSDREPLIRVSGLESPLQIRGLGPGCETLWSQPFDGTVDGEAVLFFVITPDAPRLQQAFVDDHLLSRRPAILVKPREKEGQSHTWIAMSALKGRSMPVRPFGEVDLLRVDYGRLFGLERPAETIFIPTPYREAIERIAAHIEDSNATPAATAMLRSFAELLLVQGAGMRAPVFGREELGAREIGALLDDAGLRRFCGADPLLASMWTRFFADAFAALQRTIESSRQELAKAEANGKAAEERRVQLERELAATAYEVRTIATQLQGVRRELAAAEAQRTKAVAERDRLDARVKQLDADVAAAKTALVREQRRRTELERERDLAKTHWLVRLDSVIHPR